MYTFTLHGLACYNYSDGILMQNLFLLIFEGGWVGGLWIGGCSVNRLREIPNGSFSLQIAPQSNIIN